MKQADCFPVLPLRDIVVFPHMVVPLFVGREKSVKALESLSEGNARILLVAQKEAGVDDPGTKDIHAVGVVSWPLQMLKLPDGTIKLLVEGESRARIKRFTSNQDFFEAEVSYLVDEEEETQGMSRALMSRFETYAKLRKRISPEVLASLSRIDSPGRLADVIAGHLNATVSEKQELLEMTSLSKKLEALYGLMESEIGLLRVERKIRRRVKTQMEKTQREYYLNEQMKAIQRELGEQEGGRGEADVLEDKIKATKLSKEAREKAESEFKKLGQMSPMSAEATVVRNYLDWLLSLPWGKKARIKIDLEKAREILDAEHYGLEKVKERIVEHLAVQRRVRQMKGSILCLVGPPGVGKTSLGRSIARATGREFVRLSLGGIRDEAEIRGHRRTYIGSMPGRIIQSMKKVKSVNPFFLLDEIDKLGTDFRGDPAAALLEVLDPEQNGAFSDHYLEVDYDLSHVMFVTTANTTNIHPALLDRMEVIRIAGYTEEEKMEIARRHLLPRVFKSHGLKKKEWRLEDDAVKSLIRTYTREAGVRNLEREIKSLARKAVKKIDLEKSSEKLVVGGGALTDFIGPPRYRYGQVEEKNQIGIATGLAWTEVGGDLLFIEGVMLPGKGKMTVTGNLKDVMKESISAANAYVKSRAENFGIPRVLLERKDIHVHVPEGATPKDGPSAGVGVAVAIVSLMTGIPVHRGVAMTGEITLRGRVLPVGGLKEKLLTALRGGIHKVLVPGDNEREMSEVPDSVKEGLEIVSVSNMDDVIRHALTEVPEPIEWSKEVDLELGTGSVTAH